MVPTLITNECGTFKAGIADATAALESSVEGTLVSVDMDLNRFQSILRVIVSHG